MPAMLLLLADGVLQVIEKMQVVNPKPPKKARVGRASWYPYYPCFSEGFARAIIQSSNLADSARIMDSWNGSGTTTAVGAGMGYAVLGFDLNPVMVVAAKARLLTTGDRAGLMPI